MIRRCPATLASMVLVSALVFLPLSESSAATSGPAVSVIAAQDHVDLFRYRNHAVYLDLGTFIAVRGAPLEFLVRRDTYGSPITASIVMPDGSLRSVPSKLIDGWNGVRHFLRIDVMHAGVEIAHRAPLFCPNSWALQRLDDTGPFQPSYPAICGGNAFTLGEVWGIDEGWAASTSGSGAERVQLPDRHYRIRVSITKPMRRFLGIGPASASVVVGVTVTAAGGGACPSCLRTRTSTTARSSLTRAPTVSSPAPATEPDLVALPAFGISLFELHGRQFLTFGANVWDRGPAPMIVEGFRSLDSQTMKAYEYFTRDGEVVGRAPVGSLVYDDTLGHNHWHFEQFARYRLLDQGRSKILRSHKQGFCLGPTDAIDLLVPGAIWRPDTLGFSSCGGADAIWIRETLPTGWGDTYFQGVHGQSFDVTDLPNGTYYIEVTANPTGALYETRSNNDTRLRKVILRGVGNHRRVSVPPWDGIDTEGSAA